MVPWKMLCPLATAIVSLVVAGCGAAGGVQQDAFTVRDSAGIVVVENHAAEWADGQGWRLASEPRVVIGVVDGAPEYQLSSVSGAAMMSDGRIVVADRVTAELRVFDDRGRFLERFAVRGQGPGELQAPLGLAVQPGDTVTVWDGPSMARSRFASDGRYLDRQVADRARIAEGLAPYSGFWSYEPLADGTLMLRLPESGPEVRPGSPFRSRFRWVRSDSHGNRIDALGSFGGPRAVLVDLGGPRAIPSAVLFSPEAHYAAGGDPFRIYTGDSERFEIAVFNADGELERIIRRTGPLRPIDAENRNSVRERRLREAEGQGLRPEMERSLAALPEETHFPAFSGLSVDAEGNLWVREYRAPLDTGTHWTVFDISGRMLGAIAFPRDIEIHDIGRDYVLGVSHDDLGVPRVILYELVKG